jgi:hypothetical protein
VALNAALRLQFAFTEIEPVVLGAAGGTDAVARPIRREFAAAFEAGAVLGGVGRGLDWWTVLYVNANKSTTHALAATDVQFVDLMVVGIGAAVLQRIKQTFDGVIDVATAAVGWKEIDVNSKRAGQSRRMAIT